MRNRSSNNKMGKVTGHKTKSKEVVKSDDQRDVGLWICDDFQRDRRKDRHRSSHFREINLPDDDELHSPHRHDIFEFFNRTTISGFLQIVTRKRWGWRVFWLLLSLMGLAMSFYQSQDVLTDYFNGKTIQIIRYNNLARVPFPSLTVCSNIRLHYRKATPELSELLCNNKTSIFSCSRTMRSVRSFGDESEEDRRLRQLLIEYQSQTPVHERADTYYGPRNKFLIKCSWKGVPCNYSDTREIFFYSTLLHGQCFTFNLGMSFNQLGFVSREFIAVLNMDRLSRKLKFNDLTANFWLHAPGTSPGLYSDNAGRIFPGDKTRLDFSMQNIRRLGSRNCFNSREHKYRILNPYYSHVTPYLYDQSSCIFYQEVLMGEKRKCVHATVERSNLTLALAANETLCTTFDCFKFCLNLTDDVLDNARWPECKTPCSEYFVKYGVNTMSLILENVVEESLLEDVGSERVNSTGHKNPFSRIGVELRNRTIALLQLSPEHNIVEDIVEENKYSVADFLGILGGNVGLWVGVSIISLAEFLELIYIWLLIKFSSSSKSKTKTFIIKREARR